MCNLTRAAVSPVRPCTEQHTPVCSELCRTRQFERTNTWRSSFTTSFHCLLMLWGGLVPNSTECILASCQYSSRQHVPDSTADTSSLLLGGFQACQTCHSYTCWSCAWFTACIKKLSKWCRHSSYERQIDTLCALLWWAVCLLHAGGWVVLLLDRPFS